jgi:hypothetical protein
MRTAVQKTDTIPVDNLRIDVAAGYDYKVQGLMSNNKIVNEGNPYASPDVTVCKLKWLKHLMSREVVTGCQ